MDLRGLLAALRRRWKSIALVAGIVMAGVAAFAVMTPPLYSATSQILIDPRDRRVLQTEVTSNALGSDASLLESQVRIITSDTVLRRVAVSLSLATHAEFGRDVASTPESVSRAVEALSRRVTVRRAEKTYILDIRATARDPVMAARIADAVAAAYLADQSEAAQQNTRRATGALTSRLDELRTNLRRAEDEAQAFRQRNGIVGAQGATVTEQQLVELNQRLVLARARAAEAQARVDAVNRVMSRSGTVDPGSISDALASNVVTALRTQFAEISRRESELATQLGPRHPTVIDVRSQLANVRRLITEELARIAEASRTELSVARASEQSLSRDLDRLQQRTLETNHAQIRLRELEREVEAARQLYEAFLTRSLQTSEQERIEMVNARIIAQATVPTAPSFPPRSLLLVLGLVGGLGLGVGAALLREHFDDRIRSASALRQLTGLDVLGLVPAAGRRSLTGRDRPLTGDVLSQPATPFGSALRLLRNELRDGAKTRSIAVTSAQSGDGKTTLALNLGLAAAVAGERVLIVDADLANRGLSRIIAPDAPAGLIEVLDGEARLMNALIRDPRSGLMALTVRNTADGVVERPSRGQFAMLLDAARHDFDLVIFDVGPLLQDFGAKAVLDAADEVLIVARSGRTSRRDLLEAMQHSRLPAAKLRGAVLNMADMASVQRYGRS